MTGPQVLVRRSGVAVDFGFDDGSPLPPELCDYILPQFTYNHVRHLRGAEQLLPDGGRRHVEITPRRLYDIIGTRVQTGFGFTPRIVQALQHFGYSMRFEDLTQTYGHADRYVPHWDALERVCGPDSWRPRQRECLETIASVPGGIINAAPAFGKSEIIARLGLLYPRATIAVVARRKDVALTIERRLHRYLPDIGFYGDGKQRPGRVSVFIAKSMHHAHTNYDFLLADEIHELAADVFAEVMVRAFANSRMFGFSATWDKRADGSSIRLEYMFGPEIFTLGWKEATALGLVVPIHVRWVPIVMRRNPIAGLVQDTAKKRHAIWRNQERNHAIAETMRTHGEDEQGLVLVETVEHAIMLKQFLPEYELCYDGGSMTTDDLNWYVHQNLLPAGYVPVDAARRESLRRAFEDKALKKVIATDVWSTGVSFEQLSVLFRADARSSEILDDQAPGRVARIHEPSGKQFGVVYDCWDAFDPGFRRRSEARFRRYKAKGWQQQRPTTLGEPNG